MMKIFAIALVLLVTSCGIKEIENRFCGFTPDTEAQLANIHCDNRQALCPKEPSKPNETSFCQIDYAREPGFWFQCGPQANPVCPQSACVGKTDEKPLIFDFASACTGIGLAYAAINFSDERVKERLGDQASADDTPVGEVRFIHYPKDDVQWIVFRGSLPTCNWAVDLDHDLVASSQLGGMNIHHGFLATAESAIPPLLPLLDAHKEKKIRIVGHSLGGAVAILGAMLLADKGYVIDKVITYGQPHVTDELGAQAFEQNYAPKIPLLRVIHNHDLIPSALFAIDDRYAHFGPELRIEPSTSGTTFALLTQPDGRKPADVTDIGKIIDHLPQNYLARFKELSCDPAFLKKPNPT